MIRRCAAVACSLAVTACTVATIVAITIDLRSFIPHEDLQIDVSIPTGYPLTVYLLPGVVVDPIDAGPDASSRRGSLVDLPEHDAPEGVDLRAGFRVEIDVDNLGEHSLSSVSVRLFFASATVEDVYADGVELISAELTEVVPGASARLTVAGEASADEDAYAAPFRENEARVGVMVTIAGSELALIPARVSVRQITVTVSARPLGLLQ